MKMLTMTEAKLLVREPLALFWGLAFPMALLAVMGLSSSDIGGVPLVTIYEPIVIAFIGVVFGVQGVPVQVAGYRERRILRRLATTPAGPVRVVAAQLIVSLVVVLADISSDRFPPHPSMLARGVRFSFSGQRAPDESRL